MIPMLSAVANAIHSATGIRLIEIPMTREGILREIKCFGGEKNEK